MVFDEKMTLLIIRKILGSVVHDRGVGIPLDIVEIRIFRHDLIDNIKDEVLHLRV